MSPVKTEKKKKIALVISGAVSLGSYQAGVLYELFSLLKQLGDKSEFEIDVIAGASAGSVNSIIFGLAMMYDYNLIDWTKRIWLKGLDIAVLLEQLDEPSLSILSNRVINELKKDLLDEVKRSNNNFFAGAPDKVKIALTLSNLSGIPYPVKFSSKSEEYKLTTFADWYTIDLQKGKKDAATLQEIERMIDVAIASGAFPFAFPAKKLKRRCSDYKGTLVGQNPSGEVDFIYVDGGVFNNEPINRAKELVDSLDDSEAQRIYLCIDPTPPEAAGKFDGLDMLSVGMRLVPAILSEAHFRDWYHAVKINQRLQWQEKLINGLREILIGLDSGRVHNVNMKLSEMAAEIMGFKAERAGHDVGKYVNENKKRVHEFLKNKKFIKEGDEQQVTDTLSNFALVMECVAGLRGKKQLDIRLLSPWQKGMLAGDFLINFGGFFSPEYREHDFNIGRLVAREFVGKTEEEDGLGMDISGCFLEPCPYNPQLNYIDIKDAPFDNRVKVKSNLIERVDSLVNELLKKYGVGVMARVGGAFLLPLASVLSWNWLIRRFVKWRLTKMLNKKLAIPK